MGQPQVAVLDDPVEPGQIGVVEERLPGFHAEDQVRVVRLDVLEKRFEKRVEGPDVDVRAALRP